MEVDDNILAKLQRQKTLASGSQATELEQIL
jgi:hypothetical protein